MKVWHRRCCAWKRGGWRGREEERRVNGVHRRGREISGHGAQHGGSVKPVRMMLREGLLREGKGRAAPPTPNQYNMKTTRLWCFPGAVGINEQHIDNVGERVDRRDGSACRGKGARCGLHWLTGAWFPAHGHRVRDAKQALICWIVHYNTIQKETDLLHTAFLCNWCFFFWGGGIFPPLSIIDLNFEYYISNG